MAIAVRFRGEVIDQRAFTEYIVGTESSDDNRALAEGHCARNVTEHIGPDIPLGVVNFACGDGPVNRSIEEKAFSRHSGLWRTGAGPR